MIIKTPKKIFIVDDDEMLTMALSDRLLKDAPHDISIYHTGEDCAKDIAKNPEVVILDFYLNSQKKDAANGLEVLQSLKKALPQTRFIMLSSQENYFKATQTIQKGAELYVIKDETAFDKIANMI